jgi:PKD repeat protein
MRLLVFVPLFFLGSQVMGQYTINGNASIINCHCYTLTPNANNQSGSVWNNFKIDLSQSFDFNFDISLGCNDGTGADGIVFVLQPISTSVGGSGGGMGFSGISPSIGITIDTWENTDVADPAFDHISIQLNGNLDHSNAASNIAGPVTALGNSDNIEDCQRHTFRIKWDATTKELVAYVDGIQRVSAVKDFVTDIFNGDPNVFWGFTAGTGGAVNLQQFCTALSPQFNLLPGQNRCINEPITFVDTTISFTNVLKRYWDFGDGSPIDSVTLNPVHTYTAAGDYTVTQTVLGADGCSEVNTETLRISGIPVADFTFSDSCVSNQITFTDASTVAFGTINTWYWDADNTTTATTASFATQYATGGDKNIRLWVKTAEGCVSDTITQTVHIYARPVVDFSVNDSICLGTPMNFNGIVVSSPDPVQVFAWNFGDNNPVNTQNANYLFPASGPHTVILAATSTSNAGCLGLIEKTVFVRAKPTASFKNDFVCQGVISALSDSSFSTDGNAITRWWWDTGNGISTQQDPIVVYNTVDTPLIKLVVQAGSCISDTFTRSLIIAAKPVVDFSINGSTCDGDLLQFTDSSTVANGSVAQWAWYYQNAQWSTEQNPGRSFSAGNQTVRLAVVSDRGCTSDTIPKNFTIISKPNFNFNFTEACAGAVAGFTATDLSGTIQKWQWDFGDGNISLAKDTQNVFTNAGVYKVTLSVEAGTGCINTDSASINIYSSNALIEKDTIIAASGEPVQLNATGGNSYEWLPLDGLNNNSIANPVATNTENREYIVRAYTPVGCSSYDTVLVRIFNGPEIYVPSAFNPLSTVGNHIFRAIPVGISRFKYLTVYNRLGQVVFSTSNPAQGWDGTFKGKPLDPAAYVWVAAGTTFRGTEIVRKGTVVLVR